MLRKLVKHIEIKEKYSHKSKRGYLVLAVLFVLTGACIGPFEAEIDEEPVLISIEGSIIKGSLRQTVVISKSTSLANPHNLPVRGCDVSVIDEFDKQFNYTEIENGSYLCDIADEDLVVDRKYKLRITTADGDMYESRFERLVGGVDIDTVYYIIEDRVDAISGEEYSGIQFYVDIQAPDSTSKYFRWKLDETYEFNSVGPISYFYYEMGQVPVYPDDMWGVFRCWKSEEIQGEFLSSTINLENNEKKMIPLNYVSTLTERLRIKYSLYINQYAIDEEAYKYFELNKIASEEGGGLYTRQPRQPLTNMQNVNDSTERVLGYFWVSSRSYVRMMVPQVPGLDVKPNFCAVEPWNYDDHGEGPFSQYILEIDGVRYTGASYCFDCTKRGGSTKRPSYWD